jgi:hypothetical protein
MSGFLLSLGFGSSLTFFTSTAAALAFSSFGYSYFKFITIFSFFLGASAFFSTSGFLVSFDAS